MCRYLGASQDNGSTMQGRGQSRRNDPGCLSLLTVFGWKRTPLVHPVRREKETAQGTGTPLAESFIGKATFNRTRQIQNKCLRLPCCRGERVDSFLFHNRGRFSCQRESNNWFPGSSAIAVALRAQRRRHNRAGVRSRPVKLSEHGGLLKLECVGGQTPEQEQ